MSVVNAQTVLTALDNLQKTRQYLAEHILRMVQQYYTEDILRTVPLIDSCIANAIYRVYPRVIT